MSERRYALIVASYDYQDEGLRKLVAPGENAEALAQVLADPEIGGYQVQTLLNEPEYRVRRATQSFYHRRKKDDLLLLYICGHGLKDADTGQLYFAAINSDHSLLASSALSADFVNNMMHRSRSERQVLLLDCCHSGAFARGMFGAEEAVGTGDYFRKGKGKFVLTASDDMQYAWEQDEPKTLSGGGVRSVFTEALIEGLESGAADHNDDGSITPEDLYEYVHARITKETAKQEPQRWDFGVQGQLVIARNPRAGEKSVPLPADLQAAIESRYAGIRVGAVSELEALRCGSNPGLALSAEHALEVLAEDDSLSVRAAVAAALGDVDQTSVEKPEAKVPAQASTKKPETKIPAQTSAEKLEAKDPAQIRQQEPEETEEIWRPPPMPIEFDWVRIAAGEFVMGSDTKQDNLAFGNETPQHKLYLPEFYIARTPVTNEQYKVFLDATGTGAPKHWKNGNFPMGKRKHPVVNVSWSDAAAFCKWVGVRLPTEAEWEKAARGTDGRLYPWGNEAPNNRRCNFSNNIGNTTPVGKYWLGANKLYDMAGNVWEWTSSKFEPYPYKADDGREDQDGDEPRTLRGGSFVNIGLSVRCTFRGPGFTPYRRDGGLGFRVAVAQLLDSE